MEKCAYQHESPEQVQHELNHDLIEDIKFLEAQQLLIEALKTALQEKLFLTKETINEFLAYFVSTLPDYIKAKLSVVSCES